MDSQEYRERRENIRNNRMQRANFATLVKAERGLDQHEAGYADGYDACRSAAAFTIIMTGLFCVLSGFLAGMAFVDLIL